MVEGTLTINLDPPYASLDSDGERTGGTLSIEQIRGVLEDLGINRWPLRDCVIRLQGPFSAEYLKRMGFRA